MKRKEKKESNSKVSGLNAEVKTPATPLHGLPTEDYNPFLLVDDEMWLTIMELLLGENPKGAESLARLFYVLKESIERGPEGVTGAYFALIDGICKAYEYTEAHQKGLRLFNLFLAGKVRKRDEPLTIISAAIARAVQEEG
jgi:hypothetical protein